MASKRRGLGTGSYASVGYSDLEVKESKPSEYTEPMYMVAIVEKEDELGIWVKPGLRISDNHHLASVFKPR
jgi:hypothetical protein